MKDREGLPGKNSAQLRAAIIGCLLLGLFVVPIRQSAYSQPVIQKRDPDIEKMVREVSAANIERTIRKLVSFRTRHSLSSTRSDKEGIGAARRWIKAQMEGYARASGGRLKVAFDPFIVKANRRRIPRTVQMKNVLATLPGTDTANPRILIVSGHYDSRNSEANDSTHFAPGANDDASGTAVTMELARIMSQRSYPATIIFATVPGEEQGLYGSTHLAKRAKDEDWNIIGMITNDIVGNSVSSGTGLKDNTHFRVFSEGVPALQTERQARLLQAIGGENDSPAREFARYIKEVGERYVDQMSVVLIYRRDRFLRGGDHTPFSRLGFTAVRFSEINEDFTRQHQNVRTENGIHYGDLPDNVDYPYTAKICRVNLAVLANLALAPDAPDSVGIVVRKLTNSTTLRWKTAPGIKPAGFYVLMRETSAPLWQKKFYVGNVNEVTLPYSKDNYIFAVQSVDSAGHESLPIFPLPVR